MANWYYFRNRRIEGPVNDDALRTLIGSQDISSETLLWSDKLDAWKKLREIDPFKLSITGEAAASLSESLDLDTPERKRSFKIEIKELKPETQEPEPETREPKPEFQKPKLETWEPKTEIHVPGPESRKPGIHIDESRVNAGELEVEERRVPEHVNSELSASQNGQPPQSYRFSKPGGFMHFDAQGQGPSSVDSYVPAEPEKFGFSIPDRAAISRADSNINAEQVIYPGKEDEAMPFNAAAEDHKEKARKIKDVNQRRPWVRFWAKVVDHLLWIGVFSYAMYLFEEYADPSLHAYVFYRPDAFAYADYVPYLVIFLLYMLTFILFEALLLSTLGTTMGKWLLGTSVRTCDGSRLGYPRSLARGFGVWVKGLGLGIPVVSLVTLIVSYSNLTGEHGKTSWDCRRNNFVLHRRLNFFGIMAVVIILLASISVSLAALILSGLIEVPGYITAILNDTLALLNINMTP